MRRSPSEADIQRAAEIIRAGGVVAFPTETVYGLGADVFQETAVAKIFELKGRPRFDPLIVHVVSQEQARALWKNVPEAAERLMEKYWPGPLTLVLEKSARVPDIVTAGLSTAAVRMPAHPIAQALLKACGVPLAAPSANLFGRVSSTTADAVREDFGESLFVLDGGATSIGLESTVISLAEGRALLLRPGAIPVEEIEKIIGRVERAAPSAEGKPLAPGMLASHYAPRKPLYILHFDSPPPQPSPIKGEGGKTNVAGFSPSLDGRGKGAGVSALNAKNAALLCFSKIPAPLAGENFAHVEILSPTGDLREAACKFFAALRRLDAMGGVSRIVAERFPDAGFGCALNDRLSRASSGEISAPLR